ncbi:MAG TPA: NUDIX domain-containing protein [Candidatus Saccharimonadales bacterium]
MQVAGAVIKNQQGEFLLQLRDGKVSRFKNCWTLFGGRIEGNEKPQEALLRELNEELNLVLSDIESMREIQRGQDADGVPFFIYEVLINKTIDQLTLCEGAAMKYVSKRQLFDHAFAFNTEEILRKYVQTMTEDS